jgi:hypothetical protein
MDFTTDLSRLEPAVRQRIIKKVRHEDRARHELGLVEQQRLAQLHQAVGRVNTEVGRQAMVISPDQYVRFMQVYGPLCWADPEFGKWVLKQDQHADLKVKDVGTRIQSGWTPRLGVEPKLMNSKTKPDGIVAAGKYSRLTETA